MIASVPARRIVQVANPSWLPGDQFVQRKAEFLEAHLDTTEYPNNLFGDGDLAEIDSRGGNQQYADYLKGLIGVNVEE